MMTMMTMAAMAGMTAMPGSTDALQCVCTARHAARRVGIFSRIAYFRFLHTAIAHLPQRLPK
jgi:hypothetical protein